MYNLCTVSVRVIRIELSSFQVIIHSKFTGMNSCHFKNSSYFVALCYLSRLFLRKSIIEQYNGYQLHFIVWRKKKYQRADVSTFHSSQPWQHFRPMNTWNNITRFLLSSTFCIHIPASMNKSRLIRRFIHPWKIRWDLLATLLIPVCDGEPTKLVGVSHTHKSIYTKM